MKSDNTIERELLPYEKLAVLGIDRQKADALPEEVKRKLVSGEVTPLMQVSINARNGDVITLPLKLQLDPETKSIIHRKSSELQLEQKLKDMEFQCKANPIELARIGEPQPEIAPQKVNDIELGTQQKQQVREGKPVELNVGGEKVSVGLDLKEPQGFKVMKGDMKEWERQQKLSYDEHHPEYYGLVQTDKNRWEYQQVVDKQSTERLCNSASFACLKSLYHR